MIVFPNAKINLGLRIIDKRPDGYHNIDSYMIPVDFCDALEIVPSDNGFEFSSSGITIDGSSDDNLVVKAFNKMASAYNLKPVKIHLHKVIPAGAGLGGGSSDAAFTISLLRKLFDLKICNSELENVSEVLGCDCPFFITNKPQKIEGKGFATKQFLRLPEYQVVIIVPDLEISTAWAYSVAKPSNKSLPDPDQILNREDQWRDLLVNDFEEVIFNYHPQLAGIKNELYKAGAFYASMSGSGSAIYGLFKQPPQIPNKLSEFFVWQGMTRK